MRHIGFLSVAGFFAALAVANAQMPPTSAGATRFDGTYSFVSAKPVNETFTALSGRTRKCGSYQAGPLIVASGQARYDAATPRTNRLAKLGGTVGLRGELTMREIEPDPRFSSSSMIANGRIGENNTVTARQIARSCNYDLVWQKASR